MKIEDVARICHEANRGLCEAHGDMSQVPWDEAPDWQRDSAIDGVMFHLDSPPGLLWSPEASHENWMKEKAADGWKHGEVKDAEARTHPNLVPFAELPREQQAKDYLFGAVCRALLPFVYGDAG